MDGNELKGVAAPAGGLWGGHTERDNRESSWRRGETEENTERLGRERRTCGVEVSTRKSGQVDKWDENNQKRTKKRKRKLVEHATGGQTTVEKWPCKTKAERGLPDRANPSWIRLKSRTPYDAPSDANRCQNRKSPFISIFLPFSFFPHLPPSPRLTFKRYGTPSYHVRPFRSPVGPRRGASSSN
jgi:hypothetical protein